MKKNLVPNIEYQSFDLEKLQSNPTFLHSLAEFYCSIWIKDPNFGEYRVCPECEQYYSENDVEVKGITDCSGKEVTHPVTKLVPAWVPDDVAKKELLGNASFYGDNFYGLYAVDKSTDEIVGFTWGWLQSIASIEEKWGQDIARSLGSINSTYYSEIAVDPNPSYRGKGIGKELCGRLAMWMKSAHPTAPSFLRTHKDSYAKTMFEAVGYRYFADDPQHGDGRIMLMVDQGQNLVP